VRGPQPRALELETPRFERGVAPVGKPQNNRAGLGEPGDRVFKLKTSKSVRGKLKELYDVLTSLLPRDELPKSALRYREEWEDSFLQVIRNRLATGKWLKPKEGKGEEEEEGEEEEQHPKEAAVPADDALHLIERGAEGSRRRAGGSRSPRES